MKPKTRIWLRRGFFVVFLVLTFFCWCPWGYGSYGPVGRVLGMPTWAAIALAVGVVLFALEWIYLFLTGFAITDEGFEETIAELERVDVEDAVPAGKDS